MDWVHRARCKDEDPELFFPVGTTGPAASQIAQAKAICMQCDVRTQCLEWAMATIQDAGVWGGLSEEERRALRRARRRAEAARVPISIGR
jgi:WhiB family redox-sensing transcriptional regulator